MGMMMVNICRFWSDWICCQQGLMMLLKPKYIERRFFKIGIDIKITKKSFIIGAIEKYGWTYRSLQFFFKLVKCTLRGISKWNKWNTTYLLCLIWCCGSAQSFWWQNLRGTSWRYRQRRPSFYCSRRNGAGFYDSSDESNTICVDSRERKKCKNRTLIIN